MEAEREREAQINQGNAGSKRRDGLAKKDRDIRVGGKSQLWPTINAFLRMGSKWV